MFLSHFLLCLHFQVTALMEKLKFLLLFCFGLNSGPRDRFGASEAPSPCTEESPLRTLLPTTQQCEVHPTESLRSPAALGQQGRGDFRV